MTEDGFLRSVRLPRSVPRDFNAQTLKIIRAEISRFRISFDHASGFTRRVWRRLMRIPPGEVMTYAEVAREIGSPRAARAVGMACAANPLLLAVPCHRVVASRGPGGFRAGLAWKKKILDLERAELG